MSSRDTLSPMLFMFTQMFRLAEPADLHSAHGMKCGAKTLSVTAVCSTAWANLVALLQMLWLKVMFM